MDKPKARVEATFHTGYDDGLDPLDPLDINAIRDFDEMVQAMGRTAFGARKLGEGADVLYEMVSDPKCFVVATFSGAMTVAKMSLLICEMIDRGMVQAVITTGALISHGFVETTGKTHFKYEAGMKDETLYEKGYARVYDTLELETNLTYVEDLIFKVLNGVPGDAVLSSRKICSLIGEHLAAHFKERGVLISAHRKGIPIFIPAFTDSEIGLDFGLFNHYLRKKGESPLRFDPYLDIEEFAECISRADRTGIFTVGGGVPRNWAQQVGPYMEALQRKGFLEGGFQRYRYGLRICPEPAHLGGLSGCTYSEGVSWGKFVPRKEGGRWAEIQADATLVWPILLKAVIERMEKNKTK